MAGTTDQPWGADWHRLRSWTFKGAVAPHRLDIVTGMVGSGKMQAWLDGRLALTLDRPRALKPVVMSRPGMVDGYEMVIYAETPDTGATVRCDVFVNDVSITTGEPITVVRERAATLERQISARAAGGGTASGYVGYAFIVLGVLFLSFLGLALVASLFFSSSR
jgi:hypothetical protein